MTTVISVENLSKTYHLGQIGTGTFSRDLEVWWAKIRGKPNPMLRIGEKDHGNRVGEELWALKDVSFKVEQGEVFGIIGRNGAGKSTLLKILSRVTAPTSGKVKVKGRIASLLEVGTGFHPELTGRENIYLNGAILGMKRDEITRKFDEIVDFSGVEKFVDTPVKRYSSGMYVRLAFAVAAHLEPEILLVDEVLAVGDAEFQKKCLGKMGDVAQEGRTVLFVSHNLGAISVLCNLCVYLAHGRLINIGKTNEIVSEYLQAVSTNSSIKIAQRDIDSQSIVSIERIDLESLKQSSQGLTSIKLRLSCRSSKIISFNVEWHISVMGQRIAFGSPQHFRDKVLFSKKGTFDLLLEIDDMPLAVGRYILDIRLSNKKMRIFYDILNNAISFDVHTFDPYHIGWSYKPSSGGEYGPINFSDKTYIE